MADYGGLGGITGCRAVDEDDAFEMAVQRALGVAMRTGEPVEQVVFCQEVWSALSNVVWRHENGDTASYTFRAAGDLIAAMRGKGNYMDWYCNSPYGRVSDRVAVAMAKEGWSYEVDS